MATDSRPAPGADLAGYRALPLKSLQAVVDSYQGRLCALNREIADLSASLRSAHRELERRLKGAVS